MRDSMKMTVPYQFGYVLMTHLGATAVAFVFQTVAFWYFIGRGGFKEALAIIFTLIYSGMIYHSVRKLSVRDHKEYTPLKPSIFKGVMFGVMISLITVAIFIIWKWVWANCVNETGLASGGAIFVNILFNFWTFPYYGFLGASGGMITVVGAVIMLLTPVAATTAGYLAGKYNIDLLDIIERFSYEKKSDE